MYYIANRMNVTLHYFAQKSKKEIRPMKIVFKACVRNFKLSVPIIPKKGEGPGNNCAILLLKLVSFVQGGEYKKRFWQLVSA